MIKILADRLEQLDKNGADQFLQRALHGIEKEGLRVDASGSIAATPHPARLGSSLTNRYITTDFSEPLLEFVTPVFTDSAAALHFLQAIHRYVYTHLDDELIWAASMPCRIDDVEQIPIAEFGTSNIGRMKHIYRVGLAQRYGKMMQSIAGIHYNFSLPDEFWTAYRGLPEKPDSMASFRSAAYFTMIRNFRRHSWLLLYLFGASPALSRSFLGDNAKKLEPLHGETLHLPWATSLRMSDLGYSNAAQSSINVCFNELRTYTETLVEAINTPHPEYEKIGTIVDGEYRQLSTTILQIENEYYSDIRPKRVPRSGESALQALKRCGVEYVEIRNTDVNPLLAYGIELDQAHFLDAFLIACLLMGDDFVTPEECRVIEDNQKKITTRGREPGLKVTCCDGEIGLREAGGDLLSQLELVAQMLDRVHDTDSYRKSVLLQREKLEDPGLTPSAQILQSLKSLKLDHTEWVLEISKQHKQTIEKTPQDTVIFAQLAEEAAASVARQTEIEAADTENFAAFLSTYRTRDS